MLTIKAYVFPFCSGAKCLRTLISTKFNLFLTPSLLFLDILSNGPIILSHTFFSIYITSRQYLTYKHFQYGRLKNIDRFFYTFFSIIFCFTFSQLVIRCFTFSFTCSLFKASGALFSSVDPLNAFRSLH